MSQTMVVKEESPLLNFALSKLNPGIFSHPVWIRFSRKKKVPIKTIKALIIEAEKLKKEKTSDACQLLLIGAVFQNYAGQVNEALATIQEVQDLAQRGNLRQEIIWALWGASAICFQQRRFEQAAAHLTTLKRTLSDQDDWILADFVDVVRQSMPQQAKAGKNPKNEYPSNQTLDKLLVYTFGWLDFWGFAAQNVNTNLDLFGNRENTFERKQPAIPFGGWRGLQLLFRGELKINWLDNSAQWGKKRFSFWEHILSLLHIKVVSQEQESETQIIDADVAPIEAAVVQTPVEITPDVVTETESIQVEPLLISVQMLGKYNQTIHETPINLPSSRSLSLLKYLILNHRQNTPREILIDLFWPDVSMERGRNNLNVAMNGIRTSLRMVTDTPVIIYKDNAYGMAQDLQFWVDVEEFEKLVDSGRRLEVRNRLSAAISDYEAAVSLYQGDFLEENPYENWTVLPRERLRLAYLTTLDRLSHIYFSQTRYAACASLCQLILIRDPCREDAHCLLMQCYNHQGQDHLALRQYQSCVKALRIELEVEPMPETVKIYNCIRRHEPV